MKLTAEERKTRTTIITDLSKAEQSLQTEIAAYNTILAEANTFMDEVKERLQGDFDDKSEKWQEGDAGVAASEMIADWEAEFDEVEVELGHSETLEGLPEETS